MNILFTIIESFIRNLPTTLGRKVRWFYYSKRLGSCGKNLIVDKGVIIYNPGNIFVGDNVWLDDHCILIGGSSFSNVKHVLKPNDKYIYKIGEIHLNGNNHIAPFAIVQGHGGISIGLDVTIGAGSKVYSMSHHYKNTEDEKDNNNYYFSSMSKLENQFLIVSPVTIGNGCAIGLNSVVLPGTHIPDGTWVGVNSTVSCHLEANAIYASKNAEFIKYKQ